LIFHDGLTAFRALEAQLMPLGIQSDDSLSDDWLAASLALVGVLLGVTLLAVGGVFNLHEFGADQFGLATPADEMILMPVGPHGRHNFIFDRFATSFAFFQEFFRIATVAVRLIIIFLEFRLFDRLLAVKANKMIRMIHFIEG
jgi:hypothetical protein